MTAPKGRKRQRRKAVRKEESIRIRVTEAQKQALTEAATGAGLGVSSWLLMLGLREVQGAPSSGEK